MTVLRVTPVLNRFRHNTETSLSLVSATSNAGGVGGTGLSRKQVYMIFELSLLKIFVAWELLLEDSFIRYLAGGKSDSGYGPKRYARPRNLKHAREIVEEGREYADWSSLDVVIRKAEMYFVNGEPFRGVLRSVMTNIQDLKTIRNAIVHMSSYSRTKFRTLVRSKLGHAPKGIVPGRLLSMTIPRKNLTYIEDYEQRLVLAASLIVK